MGFAIFMASPLGRWLRIAAGVAMVAAGLVLVGGSGGTALAIAGLLPIGAGVANVCAIAPLLGVPFRGTACLAERRARA